jgi:hypothetical protein
MHFHKRRNNLINGYKLRRIYKKTIMILKRMIILQPDKPLFIYFK